MLAHRLRYHHQFDRVDFTIISYIKGNMFASNKGGMYFQTVAQIKGGLLLLFNGERLSGLAELLSECIAGFGHDCSGYKRVPRCRC